MADQADAHSQLWRQIRQCTACAGVPGLEVVAAQPMYVPLPPLSPQPTGQQVTYLLVGAEPSENWQGPAPMSRREANAVIDRGYRSYTGNQHVMALTFAAREWLVGPNEAYAITDLAKCSVAVSAAGQTRRLRYDTCVRWLDREIALYRPRVVIAVGSAVAKHLADANTADRHDVRVDMVPHFSPSNRGRWSVAPEDLILPWPYEDFERYALETRERYHPGSSERIIDATRKLLSLYRREFARIARLTSSDKQAGARGRVSLESLS